MKAVRSESDLRLILAALSLWAAGGACTAAPWNMGTPRSGVPSIPSTSAAPGASVLRAEAAAERAACRKVTELRALVELDRRDALQDAQRRRLVELLEERAAALGALGRAIPRADDLRRIARLDPGRAIELRPVCADAERDAGDAWLAIGDWTRAGGAFARSADLGGSSGLGFRIQAARREPIAAGTPIPELEAAIRQLPARAVLTFAQAYVNAGGATPDVLARSLAATRAAGDERRPTLEAALAARLTDGVDAQAPSSTPPPRPAPPSLPSPPPVALAPAGGCAVDQGDPDEFVLGGPLLAARLLPLASKDPDVLAPGTRSRKWADLILAEDPTSPDALELAAVVDGLAGRVGGTERKLIDMVFYTPDRSAGLQRAARVWERVGQPRAACAAWLRAARWNDEPEDDLWRKVIACTRQDPGAGDWQAVRRYVLERAAPERREALAATLDAAASHAAATLPSSRPAGGSTAAAP